MTIYPVYIFAAVGLVFACRRSIETGREALFASVILPAGYLWSLVFP